MATCEAELEDWALGLGGWRQIPASSREEVATGLQVIEALGALLALWKP